MNDPLSDFMALRQFLEAFPQVEELAGIVDRVLSLRGDIPALEQQKAGLQKDIAAAKETAARVKREAEIAAAEHAAMLTALEREREAEAVGLEADKKTRDAANVSAMIQQRESEAVWSMRVRADRATLLTEIEALANRKSLLERDLAALLARHSQR